MCGTTSTTTTSTHLPVIQEEPSCACCAPSAPSGPSSTEVSPRADVKTFTYPVTGMTCGHCASAVTSELHSLPGVGDVQVDLVADGTSTVKVTSETPLSREQVASALEEAGDYQLAAN